MWQKPVLHTKEQGWIYKWGKHEYPDPAYHQLSPHSHYHHASPRHFPDPKVWFSQSYKSSSVKAPMECRGNGFGDGTSPVSACLGEEPEVGKGKNHSDSGRNKHGKATAIVTRGTDHVSAGCRSVCVSSYALPLLSDCQSPFAILSWASAWCPCVPTRHGVRPQITRAGESVVPAKQGVSFCRSRCNHTEYQAGLASKQAEWPWDWDGTHQLSEAAGGTKRGPRWAARESVVFGIGSWACACA